MLGYAGEMADVRNEAAGARYLATTPGGIGNLGPGLDVLGCAIAGPRDEVIADGARLPASRCSILAIPICHARQ